MTERPETDKSEMQLKHNNNSYIITNDSSAILGSVTLKSSKFSYWSSFLVLFGTGHADLNIWWELHRFFIWIDFFFSFLTHGITFFYLSPDLPTALLNPCSCRLLVVLLSVTLHEPQHSAQYHIHLLNTYDNLKVFKALKVSERLLYRSQHFHLLPPLYFDMNICRRLGCLYFCSPEWWYSKSVVL